MGKNTIEEFESISLTWLNWKLNFWWNLNIFNKISRISLNYTVFFKEYQYFIHIILLQHHNLAYNLPSEHGNFLPVTFCPPWYTSMAFDRIIFGKWGGKKICYRRQNFLRGDNCPFPAPKWHLWGSELEQDLYWIISRNGIMTRNKKKKSFYEGLT